MVHVAVNIKKCNECSDYIRTLKEDYLNRRTSFMHMKYNIYPEQCSNLFQYLNQLRSSYTNLSKNLDNLSKYIDNYLNDINVIESVLSGIGFDRNDVLSGTVTYQTTNETVNTKLYQNKESIVRANIKEFSYFKVFTFGFDVQLHMLSSEEHKKYNQSMYAKDLVHGDSEASFATGTLAFSEGVLNIIEGIGDGALSLYAGALSIIDEYTGTDYADNISNVIEYDWTKEGYYSILKSDNSFRYIDPNALKYQMASNVGYMAGMVALSVGTSGIGAAVGGTAASTTAITAGINATTGFLSTSGSSTENALKYGATTNQALMSGYSNGVVGGIAGHFGGKFDALARSSGSLGKAIGYSFASFGVGSVEPAVNLAIDTSIYKNDGTSGYWNNFIQNANAENLTGQMIFSGGVNSVGTFAGYMGEFLEYKKFKSDFMEGYTNSKFSNSNLYVEQPDVIHSSEYYDFSQEMYSKLNNERFRNYIYKDKEIIEIENAMFNNYDIANKSQIPKFSTEVKDSVDLPNSVSEINSQNMKPVIEPLSYIESVNSNGVNNEIVYQNQIESFANRWGITYEEAQTTLDQKVIELVNNSEFAIRTEEKSLALILNSGEFKNQFQTGDSKGACSLSMRLSVEEKVLGVPSDVLPDDRPVYGLLVPQLDINNESVVNYYKNGPGSSEYGTVYTVISPTEVRKEDFAGVVCILEKDSVIPNTTVTFGDSLNKSSCLLAMQATNPHFFGAHDSFAYNMTKTQFENASFIDIFPKYPEIQLHGKETHSISNIKELVFLSPPSPDIISRVNELGIKYTILD